MLRQIPGTEEIEFKPEFVKRYKKLLGKEYDQFVKYSLSFPRRSIRVNTLKTSVDEIKKRLAGKWTLTQIPWSYEGFWIEGERRDVGNLMEHSLGYIYIQEAASMIPPLVLDPKPGELVLDMCASPGSKATELASLMENKGILFANDITGNRMKPLGINMQRAGVSNSIITIMKGQSFARSNIEFDKILVDAPCSGTGTIRKSLKTIEIWNPLMITRLSTTQKSLLKTAFKILKKDGIVVYSTCSVEPEENEEVIDNLLRTNSNAVLEKVEFEGKRSNVILEFEGKTYDKEIKKCLRIWPQDNDTEGFFVAKIKKL